MPADPFDPIFSTVIPARRTEGIQAPVESLRSSAQSLVRRIQTLRGASRHAVALFCGAEQPPDERNFDAHYPGRAQILPIEYAPLLQCLKPLVEPKSNGCGTQVHTSVVPNRGGNIWVGSSKDLTDSVVALEDKYVPKALKKVLKTQRQDCGCLRRPVGCAVCGNALGMRVVHCTTHSESSSPSFLYEFVPSGVSPPFPHTESIRISYQENPPPLDFLQRREPAPLFFHSIPHDPANDSARLAMAMENGRRLGIIPPIAEPNAVSVPLERADISSAPLRSGLVYPTSLGGPMASEEAVRTLGTVPPRAPADSDWPPRASGIEPDTALPLVSAANDGARLTRLVLRSSSLS
ncbi:hypothetical protein B0H11DRAFT_562935 [Mycena galericulata]|nr:hypothetical protein B0H11DRAFT_562935 [Mycena galericulata]